jgi:type I restriction enzyme S subunit
MPPLPVQQKIAKILSAYDDLIENNLKRIKLLEEMAQITYEEWFVRMRFPGYESTPIDSATGLPEGWNRKENGDCCEVSGGGTPSREIPEYWKCGTVKWFSPTDLSKANSLCLLDSSDKITELGLKKSSARLMGKHTFMMTSRATIGLFGLIDAEYSTNQGFINVTPLKPHHKYYLLFNFKNRVDEFIAHASGATFPEISKSKFKKLKITWPSEDALSQFHEYCSPIISEMMLLTKQNQWLREARDILLPRLMTGVIDVESYNPADLLKEVA